MINIKNFEPKYLSPNEFSSNIWFKPKYSINGEVYLINDYDYTKDLYNVLKFFGMTITSLNLTCDQISELNPVELELEEMNFKVKSND